MDGNILYDLVLRPLSYGFNQRALLAILMIGCVSGVIGSFIVVKGMAFLTDALAHTILPGVAVAYIVGGINGPLAFGAFVMGAISALVIGWLTRSGEIKEDTAIGFVFTAMLALGIAIVSSRRDPTDLNHLLVGNILAVGSDDLIVTALAGGLVLLIVFALYKELLLNTFDPGLARTLKLPSEGLRYLLLILITLTIVIALQVIGVTLIAAMLVTPAAAAYLVTRRLSTMMGIAALIGGGGGMLGVVLSWHINVAPSAIIVLVISVIFLITLMITRLRRRQVVE